MYCDVFYMRGIPCFSGVISLIMCCVLGGLFLVRNRTMSILSKTTLHVQVLYTVASCFLDFCFFSGLVHTQYEFLPYFYLVPTS